MTKGIPLVDFLQATASIELTRVIISLAEGCKIISLMVNNAGLGDILGTTGDTNVQGETVQKLDDLSNKILMDYLTASETCGGYLSEENEGIAILNPKGRYVISVDPLDGSGNIDVAAPIGTIFSINERLSVLAEITDKDFLQRGSNNKAAGYFIYGSSTILVISTGRGVNGFTLSTKDRNFYLSHPDMTVSENAKIYSINQGNIEKFDPGVKQFVSYCATPDKESGRPYSLRYIGSMVGDLHRNFVKGGIFMYPANKGEAKGKLRLLYECIPMAFVTEQGGGVATDGHNRILDVQPHELHERSAIYIGSKNLVNKAVEFLKT